ncbi:heme-binding protein soul2 [Periophthalmus magnuspinnatus]|uniref:heme-binding protein soul2 n=1 Tax=Periophthalmus magnuspinnatus TaxID=409849 RepID=UPI00145A2A84|nr:heme-binding protein soul2 [Periophthalmus magnuspinnatus]
MDPPHACPLLLALVLSFTVTAQAWDQLEQCKDKICPKFTRTAQHKGYEERLYEPCTWICTKVRTTSTSDLLSALGELKHFAKQKTKQLGVAIAENTWPVLVYEEAGQEGPKYGMCWMVNPDVTLPDSDQGPVTVTTFPQTAIFVRSFGGTPSLEGGRDNANKLKQDLEEAGESFKPGHFYGAGYESQFSLFHHNEIWIKKA